MKCVLCNPPKEIAYDRGTTNLHEHLASQHPLDVSDEFRTCNKELDTYFAEKPVSRYVNPLVW